MSGWLEAGWSYSDDGLGTGTRTLDRGDTELGVHQIGVDYDNGAGGDSAVGYHVTFVYGSDSLGGNGNGSDFNLTNANIQWVLPAGVPGLTGAKLTVGRFESPVGGESIYSGGDHVTRGLVSTKTDPIAHTGLLAEKALVSGADGDVVSARLGLLNSTGSGWGDDTGSAWLVGVDYAGLAGVDLSANVLHTAATDDSTLFDIGVSMDVPGALSDVVSLLGDTSISGHLVFGENDSFGFSTGGRYDFGLPVLGDDGSTKNWYLAVRYDNYDAGSGPNTEWALTTTLGYQAADNLTMRIEYRWDRADTGLGGDDLDDEQTGLNINLVTSF
ncbi:MAG: outer membrane beta-barrel protein [Planctomycetota bacterium]|nr:outer membrane beta-barrel protein [Planctomycetota bacterium]